MRTLYTCISVRGFGGWGVANPSSLFGQEWSLDEGVASRPEGCPGHTSCQIATPSPFAIIRNGLNPISWAVIGNWDLSMNEVTVNGRLTEVNKPSGWLAGACMVRNKIALPASG